MGWLNRVRSRLGGARAAAATAPPGPLASEDVPMPPLELRRLVGPTEPEAFDPLFGVLAKLEATRRALEEARRSR